MSVDFSEFFQKYEELVAAADHIFEKIKSEYPDCVKCKTGCSDCCHALFDLSLVEALYINHHFIRIHPEDSQQRAALLEKANRADRKTFQIKKTASKEVHEGRPEEDILMDLAAKRVRCPLLNSQDHCDLYDYRPITCRLYGIPTAINGNSHTCGLSAFQKGEPYPTVHLEMLHQKLYQLSDEIVKAIKSRHFKMAEMLVPLSLALLTTYDDSYLGVTPPESEGTEGEKNE